MCFILKSQTISRMVLIALLFICVFRFTTDRDLEELKQSYEHRLEQIKHDAEKRMANAMAEADRAMAAVKSQYENQVCPEGNETAKSLNNRLLVI